MTRVVALCSLLGGCIHAAQPAITPPPTVTIAPALRAGDVARVNVLTTVSWDMPESDDPFMRDLMRDLFMSASQDVTWTVQRTESGYSVISQQFTGGKAIGEQPASMMSRMILARYQADLGPMECRVDAKGMVEDVLNGGDVAQQMQAMLEQVKPMVTDAMDQPAGMVKHPETGDSISTVLEQAIASPAMSQRIISGFINKPLFAGSWLWGQTLTVGTPVTTDVPAAELSFETGAATRAASGRRTVTLQSASEHDVLVTWSSTLTMTTQAPSQADIDTSTWSDDLRKRHEKSVAEAKRLAQPQNYTETGTLRLDRRTGMPIDGAIVVRGGNDSDRMRAVVVYSPIVK